MSIMSFIRNLQPRILNKWIYRTHDIFYRLFSEKQSFDWDFRRLKRREVEQVFINLNKAGRNHSLAYLLACYDLFPQGWWGAIKDNKVLGSFAMHDFEDKATAMSGLLLVDHSFRNLGIGKFLNEQNTSKGYQRNAFVMSVVPEMMKKQSFMLSHEVQVSELRKAPFEFRPAFSSTFKILPLESKMMPELERYDACIHPISRKGFFHKIILGCAHLVFVALDKEDSVIGYGALRPANEGWRIAPIYGDTNDVGQQLLIALCNQVKDGDPITVSSYVENNSAITLQNYLGFEKVKNYFLMYTKYPPVLPIEKVFTVASNEFALC